MSRGCGGASYTTGFSSEPSAPCSSGLSDDVSGNGGSKHGNLGINPTYEGGNPTSRKGYGRTSLQSLVKAASEGGNPTSLAGYGGTSLQLEAAGAEDSIIAASGVIRIDIFSFIQAAIWFLILWYPCGWFSVFMRRCPALFLTRCVASIWFSFSLVPEITCSVPFQYDEILSYGICLLLRVSGGLFESVFMSGCSCGSAA